MTRPPGGWKPHVIGVFLWQAALWFGYLCYTPRVPVGKAMLDATAVPLFVMSQFPLFTVIVALCVAGFATAATRCPGWRSPFVVCAYGLVAGYWRFTWLVVDVWASC
ncbi:MAG TPA: hypothetical protein VFG68_06550 [Fimbriiglobus sp.]|nr:hypothetical protein [Fimbriiglobus sp.]